MGTSRIMYHVIRNQHLDQVCRTTGRLWVVLRPDEDARRLVPVLQAAVGERPVHVAPADGDPSPDDWLVPVHVVRSRFARGDDRLSAWSRQLGRRRRYGADALNRWLGARVELVCGAPVPATAAALQAARTTVQQDWPPPVTPTLDDLWPGVRDAVEAVVGTVAADARQQLQRMANRYRLLAATALRGTVHYLGRRFFRGIWTSGLAGIEALPPNARFVYLPCHRSHFDYLVLPYALNELGQTCPIIAAGDNLNFFAIGRVLQDGFAFYIRRTFGNDTAYRTLCAAYMGESLRHGLSLAFFPEGGRSRDGWMRSPKIGMLQMVREQLDRLGDQDVPVYLVPVHVAYERCPDGKSLAKQALGRAKRQESIFRFAKSLKLLVADHGRVFLSFADPIRLTGLDGDPDPKGSTMALAQRVMAVINSHVVVTGPALTAVALLLRHYAADVAEVAADRAALAAYVAEVAAATTWPVILAPDPQSATYAHRGVVRLDGRTVGHLDPSEAACRHDLALMGLGTGPHVDVGHDPIQRASLDWHLGAIGHLLAPLGVVAGHVADGGTLTASDVATLGARLDGLRADPTMRLYWPAATSSATILAAVLAFVGAQGWGSAAGESVTDLDPAQPQWRRLALLAPVAQPAPAGATVAAASPES